MPDKKPYNPAEVAAQFEAMLNDPTQRESAKAVYEDLLKTNRAKLEGGPEGLQGKSDTGAPGAATPLAPADYDVPELPEGALPTDKKTLREVEKVGKWLTAFETFGAQASPKTPPALFTVIGLSLFATAAARRVYLRNGNRRLYPNLYSFMVAPSSLYAKSTGLSIGRDLLKQSDLLHLTLPTGITPQNLALEMTNRAPETFKDWEQADKEDWQKERPFASARAWWMDEAQSFLNQFEQAHLQELRAQFLRLYDCPDHLPASSTNQRGRLTIRNAYLNILGATTPAAMRKHLNDPENWGDGLFARFNFITPDTPPVFSFYPKEVIAPGDLPDLLKTFANKLPQSKQDGLGNLAPASALEVVLTDNVFDLWKNYARGLWELITTGKVKGRFHPNYSRLHDTGMKIALLLACMDWARDKKDTVIMITPAHLTRALGIVESWRASLHRIIETPATEDESDLLEDKVLRFIRRNGGSASERDLVKGLNMKAAQARGLLISTLDTMQDDSLIKRVEKPSGVVGGRPTRVWIEM